MFSVLIEPKRRTISAALAGVARSATRPKRASAVDCIMVRADIRFPSSPRSAGDRERPTMDCAVRSWGGSPVNHIFGGLIRGKSAPPVRSAKANHRDATRCITTRAGIFRVTEVRDRAPRNASRRSNRGAEAGDDPALAEPDRVRGAGRSLNRWPTTISAPSRARPPRCGDDCGSTSTGRLSWVTASSARRNSRPEGVICHPSSSRST